MAAGKTTKLTRLFFIHLLTAAALSFIVLGSLWIAWEVERFDRVSERLRAEFMASQKERIKREVENVIDYIHYKKSQTEARLRRDIRNRTYEAWQMAMHIYARYRATHSEAAIATMIKEALRPIRFNDGRGYFFAVSMDGVEQLYPVKPELEGRNLIDLQDSEGTYVIRHEIDIIRASGEGFAVDYWPKPEADPATAFPKISFVKHLEPLDWYIGTGEYLDDVEKDIQQEVLTYLNSIRIGREGYVFAGRWDGVSLSGPAAGENMLNVRDVNGVAVVRELIEAARGGGGFVHYVMPRIEDHKEAPKISYAAGIPDWQWYVGAGVYVDEIDRIIADQAGALRDQLRNEVVKIVLVVITLLLLVSLGARFLSAKIDKSLDSLAVFFEKAAGESTRIAPENLIFTEFASLAQSANAMIDQRERAETALRESREQLRALVNNALLGIYRVTLEGQVLFVNPRMAEMLGYQSADDFVARVPNIRQIYVDPEERRPIIRDLSAEGSVADRRVQMRRSDGRIIWIQINARTVEESTGTTVIEGFILDITEQVDFENALKESEARYRSLVELSPEAVLLHMDGTIVYINRQGARLLGTDDPHRIQGKKLTDLVHPDSRDVLAQRLTEVYRQDEPLAPVEQKYRRLDGQTVIVEATGIRIAYAGATAVLSIFRDITAVKKAAAERRELESKFQQAQKMEAVGTLAGGVAHDFNNLLTGIRGRVSLMLEDVHADHPFSEHLREIETYVHSASDLTRQLLGYARGGKYEIKPVDINALIRKSTEMFGRTHKEIQIRLNLQDNLWVVEVDRTQIEQVLLNLYVNAWQAMEGPGEMRLSTENVTLDEQFVHPHDVPPGRFVKITVSDSGSGMDAETQQRIFEPFFTTKELSRGTGLGLAAAYGIVSGHGGIITVTSAQGEGATFTIYLPASDKAVPADKPAPSEIVTGSGKILLVDDEKLILDLGRVMLARLGYEVLTAENGPRGLQLFEKHREDIALVILDMIMPGMGGGEVFDRLRAIDPGVKVLLSSGYSLDGQASAIMRRGCSGFVQKPFDLGELSRQIRQIVSSED